MSTFRNPVGPQPSSVYWRRRIVVGLALLAIIVIVVLIFVQPRGGQPEPKATETTSPTASPTKSPTTSPPNASAACLPAVLKLEPVIDNDNYQPGENPMIGLRLTNTGATACTANMGSTVQELIITSGEERYWDSQDCQTGAVDAKIVLQPNQPQSTPLIPWERTRSSTTTCDGERTPVPAGGASYHLTVKLGDLVSESTKQFILN